MVQPISSLSLGDKVKFGRYDGDSIIWKIAAVNHAGYPANSVTLISGDRVGAGKQFDEAEPNNSDSNRQQYGNNRYSHSNLRQWLNKVGGLWYAPQHGADEPPAYENEEGFLSNFTDEELEAILDTTLTVALNTATDGGGTESISDKFFLASVTEVGFSNEPGGAEGNLLPIFSDDDSRVIGSFYWLRSPYFSTSRRVGGVGSSGSRSHNAARYSSGVRPLCNLKSDILVSDTPDSDGTYPVVFATPHIITLDKPISIGAGGKLEKLKFNPKTNGEGMDLHTTDSEKLIFRKEGMNADTVNLEIEGKDGKIDNVSYVIS